MFWGNGGVVFASSWGNAMIHSKRSRTSGLINNFFKSGFHILSLLPPPPPPASAHPLIGLLVICWCSVKPYQPHPSSLLICSWFVSMAKVKSGRRMKVTKERRNVGKERVWDGLRGGGKKNCRVVDQVWGHLLACGLTVWEFLITHRAPVNAVTHAH